MIFPTTKDMIAQMVDEDSELISVYYGEDMKEEGCECAGILAGEKNIPTVISREVHFGGQPIYYYVVSVRRKDDMNPISSLKGIGEKDSEIFCALGHYHGGRASRLLPESYEEYQQPVLLRGSASDRTEVVSIMGQVDGPVNARRIRGMVLVTVSVSDPGGTMTATWFNALFMKNNLTAGSTYVFAAV